jgi:hypothetical protein
MPGNANVTFVVVKVKDVDPVVATFVRPKVTNKYDEPFMSVSAVDLVGASARDGFSAKHGTDWFAKGLAAAEERGLFHE